jgi:hypothetical protein
MKTYILLRDAVQTDPANEKTKTKVLECSQPAHEIAKNINKGYTFVPISIGLIQGLNSNNILSVYSVEDAAVDALGVEGTQGNVGVVGTTE